MKRFAILFTLWAECAFAYNLDHRPFPPGAEPESIPLLRLPEPVRHKRTATTPPMYVIESTNVPAVRFQITYDADLCCLDFTVGGQDILSTVPFSHFAEFGGDLQVSSGDLNGDGIADYVLSHWLGGCGLASGYYNLAFLLSSEGSYRMTVIGALWPDRSDYILVDGKPCLIHTSFHMVKGCADGKDHNFWVYNLLAIEGVEIRVANPLLPGYPKTIWYSFAPRHEETDLLSEGQKAKLQADSLKEIYWVPAGE